MRISVAVLAMVIILFTACAESHLSTIQIDEADPDYVYLKNAPIFATNGVGYNNKSPEATYAFGRIYQREDALNYFLKLEAEANYEGKLYALCGLFYLDYENWGSYMEKYESLTKVVSYSSDTTIIENYPVNEIIKSDEINAVRLEDCNDTIQGWKQRSGVSDSYHLDFYGGSIPEVVLDRALYHDERLSNLLGCGIICIGTWRRYHISGFFKSFFKTPKNLPKCNRDVTGV